MKYRIRSWISVGLLGFFWVLGGGNFALGASLTVEPVYAQNGMVVAGHPEAAAAGLRILKAGGNAIDAAVATSLCLGVAEPYGSGLGGKLVLLYYEAATQSVTVVEALDESSQSLDVESFRKLSYEKRREGGAAVCIPGLPSGIYMAHQRWGRMPWSKVVQPAIDLSRSGSLVFPKTVGFFEKRESRIRVSRAAKRIYLPDGKLPKAGSRLSNPDLVKTLTSFARDGSDGFYKGWVAKALSKAVRKYGGSLTLDDLSGYRAEFKKPMSAKFLNYQVFSGPAPTSGGAVIMLSLLAMENWNWEGAQLLNSANLDRFGRILQQVYPLIQGNVGDVPDVNKRLSRIFHKNTIETIRRRATDANPESPFPERERASFRAKEIESFALTTSEPASTTHFVIVDEEGNAVSATQSLSHHFGSGVVAAGTGVILNNTMNNFSVRNSKSVNIAAPGKRPRTTITPTLIFRDGRPVVVLGLPGGQRIPTGILQIILDYIVFDRPLSEAVADTRFHLRRPFQETQPVNQFEFEPDVDNDLLLQMKDLGWITKVLEDNEYFGGLNAIEIISNDELMGIADPRRTNAAKGY